MTVQLLLDRGADVHIADFGGETPLHFAAVKEEVVVVKQLLLAGADALAPDTDNYIPLLWADEADTRAALMDGCWGKLSFVMVLHLNMRRFWEFGVWPQCLVLCRGSQIRGHQRLRSHEDLRGGCSLPGISVVSGLTGELVFSCFIPDDLADDMSLVELIRTQATQEIGVLHFALAVLGDGCLVSAELTWVDLGCPDAVQIIHKPIVRDWTEEIFDAVAENNVDKVEKCLEKGQDPNCLIIDSVLCAAIERGSLPIATGGPM